MNLDPNEGDVERYMTRPYRIELTPADGEWVVSMPELPGCLSQGDTIEEALAMIRDAQRAWISARLEDSLSVPLPAEDEHSYTGRFIVRVPKDLHRSLVHAAAAEGVSLNLYVATVLAQAVGQALPARLAS